MDRTPGNNWFAVGAYALLAGVSQLLWLTWAPITSDVAAHFDVSEDAVGWLAEIFPLLYVVLAIPAAILLDRWMRETLITAATLMVAGATVRFGGGYGFALAGQVLVAVAQPAVLAAVTRIAAEHVEPERRTLAISIGSAGVFLGIVSSLLLGSTIGAADELRPLMLTNLAIALLAFLLITAALWRPAARESDERVAIGRRELVAIYTDPVLSRLGALMFLGMGVFNGIATWLETLLQPAGISSSTAGAMLVALTVAGIVGALVLPARVAERRAESVYLQVAAAVGGGAFLVLALTSVVPVAFAVLVLLGLFLLASLPVILEISERRAGRTAASAAGAIYLAGNLGGITLALLTQTLNDQPRAAFLLLGIAMLLLGPVARSLPSVPRATT